MRYSIEPKDRIYVIGYRFLSFAKNMSKNLSIKYGKKILNKGKKSTTDARKTASKRAIQKIAEATDDLIGNKIADKITNISKKSSMELLSMKLHSKKLQNNEANDEIERSKERCISPEKRQQLIDKLRLVL